ncbi:RNA polymerase subunit sigma-24 [Clostridium sp. W14A]|nr:RNA polymerase subunit sigma-24 [Clostridium sp. W14A]
MKKRDKYRVKIHGVLVDVTEETYLTYYQMARRAKHLKEKDALHGVVSYSDLDADRSLGEDTIPDMQADSVEDMAVRTLMCEKLRLCIEQLSQSEQDLIFAIYFEGKSEREYSTQTGIPNMTIHDRKMHILKKLKLLMET